MRKRRRPRALPAPSSSMRLLVSLPPDRVGLFRFLLEACDNLASFTVLDRREALLKVLFSPHQERDVQRMLEDIGESIPLVVRPWPVAVDPFLADEQVGDALPNPLREVCPEGNALCPDSSGGALWEGQAPVCVAGLQPPASDRLKPECDPEHDNVESSAS